MVLDGDLHNLNLRVLLTVSFHSAVTLAAALLHHADLVAAGVLQNFRFHGSSRNRRRTDRHRGILGKQQDLFEYDLRTRFLFKARDADFLPLRNPLLKAFHVDDGKHSGEVYGPEEPLASIYAILSPYHSKFSGVTPRAVSSYFCICRSRYVFSMS